MKRLTAIICIVLLMTVFLQAQMVKKKPAVPGRLLLAKLYAKVLVMNKWENGVAVNSAIVTLKNGSSAGSPINKAVVMVNGQRLSFNMSIREYSGNIGRVTPGQKVPFSIKTTDKRELSGHVVASFFVFIVSPKPNTLFSASKPIKVDWKFNPGATHLVVFKILRGSTQMFSTDVNGNSYTINLAGPRALRLPGLLPSEIKAQVISPWTQKYKMIGPYAAGSKGQFFASATVTIRLKK